MRWTPVAGFEQQRTIVIGAETDADERLGTVAEDLHRQPLPGMALLPFHFQPGKAVDRESLEHLGQRRPESLASTAWRSGNCASACARPAAGCGSSPAGGAD